jgi:diketogulonate reductase-like aldo/keto reductase
LVQSTLPPAVNQVQFSPFEYRRALLEAATNRNIVLEAYSPLGMGRHLNDATVQQVAGSLGRSPAQILLRWALQHGALVLPKSTHRERIEENARIFDFSLSPSEMRVLDALDQTQGSGSAREQKWW